MGKTNNAYKKPSAKDFEEAVKSLGGNLTKVAEHFQVDRWTVYDWRAKDPDFARIIKNERTKLFDTCLTSARVLSVGIPRYDYERDPLTDEILYNQKTGEPIRRQVGWAAIPDGNMIRYLLSKLGHEEGFGEGGEEEKLPPLENGVPISAWIEQINEGKPKRKKK